MRDTCSSSNRSILVAVCKYPTLEPRMTPFSKAPALVQIVLVILMLEALSLVAVSLSLVLEIFSGNFQSIFAEMFLLAIAVGSVLWIFQFSKGLLKKKRWARSAAFFWQLLQAAVGAGALAEEGLSRIVGALLVIFSAITVLLLFNSTVVEATNEENETDLTN